MGFFEKQQWEESSEVASKLRQTACSVEPENNPRSDSKQSSIRERLRHFHHHKTRTFWPIYLQLASTIILQFARFVASVPNSEEKAEALKSFRFA